MKGFDKIIGYKSVKAELERICDIIKNYDDYKKLGVKKPKGLLLYGVPGVGKTLMAKALIEESERQCFICRKNLPDGDFVKEITRVFGEAMNKTPSIILLDDMDKYANGDKFHQNEEEYITIQSCIDDIGDKDVFVIATANNLENIPESLTRAGRFDNKIEISVPSNEDSVQIISHYLKQKEVEDDVNSEDIAKMLKGYSCATLESIINQAGIYSGFAKKSKIDNGDIVKGCLRIIYEAPESLSDEDMAIKENIAYHEAGHTVVAEILEPGSVCFVNISKHESNTAGITSYYQPESYWHSKKTMETRVKSLLAGKAATEIVYGDCCDVGAKNDIYRAMKIVERFVDDYCGYGFDKFTLSCNSSNNLLERKENAMFDDIEKYYQETKRIIVENRTFLDAIAKELVKKVTLTQSDIKNIKKNIYKTKWKTNKENHATYLKMKKIQLLLFYTIYANII